jgi:endonuclease/exonuclease/phosphatase (EEP) superfamily protein YafD
MPSGLEATIAFVLAAYIIAGLAWILAHHVIEGFRVGFFVNSLAPYFALPAPFVLVLSVVVDNEGLVFAGVAATLTCAYVWLGPIIRPFLRRRASHSPFIRLATYNLLWVNKNEDAVVEAIRALDADVVALQEVTPAHQAAIEAALALDYPYRILQPGHEAYGNGLISRLQFTVCPAELQDPDWIGEPIVATFAFAGRDVTAVCCHSAPVRTSPAARERQSRALVAYARGLNRPCAILGDFNATPSNQSYSILCHGLRDVWRSAGRGLGHTFPGPAWTRAQGDGLPRPLRRFVPHWLMRIDHIFVSEHWWPLYARVSLVHGGSDHRAVVADLALV